MKKKSKNWVKIGISIDPVVAENAYVAAEGTSRTISGFFEYAVKKEIEIYNSENRKKTVAK